MITKKETPRQKAQRLDRRTIAVKKRYNELYGTVAQRTKYKREYIVKKVAEEFHLSYNFTRDLLYYSDTKHIDKVTKTTITNE